MTDCYLAQAMIDLQVLLFGENQKNKDDSRSCLFRPRRLLSSPAILGYIGQKIAEVVMNDCSANTIVGMATSGIPWAAVASEKAGLPMLFVRKSLESDESNDMIEGIFPEDGKVVLVDDLLFAGNSKRKAMSVLCEHGLTVTDVVVIIDRQLQHKNAGPALQNIPGVRLHSLINMSEIVEYMVSRGTITSEQFEGLVEDYSRFDRWFPPAFLNSEKRQSITSLLSGV